MNLQDKCTITLNVVKKGIICSCNKISVTIEIDKQKILFSSSTKNDTMAERTMITKKLRRLHIAIAFLNISQNSDLIY